MKTSIDELLEIAKESRASGFPFGAKQIATMTSNIPISRNGSYKLSWSRGMIGLGAVLIATLSCLFTWSEWGNSISETPDQVPAFNNVLAMRGAAKDIEKNSPPRANSNSSANAIPMHSSNSVANKNTLKAILLHEANASCFNIQIFEDSLLIDYETVYDITCFMPPLNKKFDMTFPKCGIGNFRHVVSLGKEHDDIRPYSYTANGSAKFTKMRPLIGFLKIFPKKLDTVYNSCMWLSSISNRAWVADMESKRETNACMEMMSPRLKELAKRGGRAKDGNIRPNLSFELPPDSFPIASQLIPVVYFTHKAGNDYALTLWFMNDSIAETTIKHCSPENYADYSYRTLDKYSGLNVPTMQEDPEYKGLYWDLSEQFKASKGTLLLELTDNELSALGINHYGDTARYWSKEFSKPLNIAPDKSKNKQFPETSFYTIGYNTTYHENHKQQSAEYYRSDSAMDQFQNDNSKFEMDTTWLDGDGMQSSKRPPMPQLVSRKHCYYEYDVFKKEYFKMVSTVYKGNIQEYLDIKVPRLKKEDTGINENLKNLVGIRIVLGDTSGKGRLHPDYTELVLWYEANKDFALLLPQRYRERLLKELDVQQMVAAGALPADSVCSVLNYDENIFGMCGNHDGALSEMRIAPNPINEELTAYFKLSSARRLKLLAFGYNGDIMFEIVDLTK